MQIRTVRRALDLLLSTHPRLRKPLALTALTCALMGASILSMLWVASAGLARPGPVHYWAWASGLWVLACFALLRSGRTLQLRDPAFTLVQIGGAMASNAVAFVIAGEARGIVPPLLALVMIFGVFGLTPRHIKILTVYGVAIYSAAVAVSMYFDPQTAPVPALAAVYLLIVAVVLVASALLTIRIHAMRQHLKRRKRELADALEKISGLATRDELTGLPNRRYMQEALRVACLNAQRTQQPLLLAQLDLDNFKRVNDDYGHATGDRVLQSFASTAQGCVRSSDILARWGGEEFLLLLNNTTESQGAALLERVRSATAAQTLALPDGGVLQVTVSLGVALLQPDEGMQALLHRADLALYRAKHQGRNRVIWAHG